MFSKKQRLNTSLFNEVFNFGKEKRERNFILKYKENNLGFARFAVAVSKKKVKFSISRHLLKRKFMHALRESFLLEKSCDFVFILNETNKNLSLKEIILTINKLELK